MGEYVLKHKEPAHFDTPDQVVEKINSSSKKISSDKVEGIPTPADVVEEIKNLKGNDRIDISHIRNGENLSRMASNNFNMNDQRYHGGGLSTVSHDTTLTGSGTPASPLSVVSSGGTPVGGLNAIQVYATSTTFNGDNSKGSFDPVTGTLTASLLKGQYTNLAGSAFINPDGSAVFGGGILIITNAGVLIAANFSGTSSGTNTGDQTNISGNAGTVTALQTPRLIGGTSFNGTADITPGLATTVTINANLTGPITSVGNATSIASSVALPGNPTTTTQTANDNSTKIATTAYVDTVDILSIRGMQALGSTMKVQSLGFFSPVQIVNSVALASGTARFSAIYIPYSMTITGVKWYQGTQGNYTADQNNYIALYSYSGGNLTQVAISSNNGNLWQSVANSVTSTPFSSPYSASTGIYYIGALYHSSAQVAQPGIGGGGILGAGVQPVDFTNSAFLAGTLASQTSLTTPISASSISSSASSSTPWFALY